MTLHDRFKNALESRGWKVNSATRSLKYTEMVNPDHVQKLYLGSAGALRRGRTVATSIPVGGAYRRALLA